MALKTILIVEKAENGTITVQADDDVMAGTGEKVGSFLTIFTTVLPMIVKYLPMIMELIEALTNRQNGDKPATIQPTEPK